MKFKSKFTNLDDILKLDEKKRAFSYMFWNLIFISLLRRSVGTMSEEVMFMEHGVSKVMK